MNSRPRGLCLIINNYEFSDPAYGDRKGTDKDAGTATNKLFMEFFSF